MGVINTPYDSRIQNLQQRLNKRHGPNRKKAQRKLQNTQARQYLYSESHAPPPPLPYSGQQDTTVGQATRDLNLSQADIAGRRLATEQQYGFGADTSNPYSQARMLERSYGQQQASTLNSYARSGQLYAGSMSNKRADDRFGAEKSLDEQIRSYQAALAGLDREGMQAQTGYDDTVTGASAQALEDARQERADPSEAPARPGYVNDFLNRQGKGGKKKGGKGKGKKRHGGRPKIGRHG